MNWVFVTILGYFTPTVVESLKNPLTPSRLCITPNNKQGVCVEIRTCLVFIEALRTGKNESFNFIRESQCGPINVNTRQPKVCCGPDDNYSNKLTSNEGLGKPKRNLLPNRCGIQFHEEFRVIHAIEAHIGEFPWMARLRHLRSDGLLSYGCAGFLISEKFVLTAAHCIRSKTLAQLGDIYQVQLGEHNTKTDPDCEPIKRVCADPPQILETANPIVHPEYVGDRQQHHDIAIVPLKQPANFTNFVFPICLSRILSQETTATVSGWGKTKTKSASPVKLKVELPRFNKVQCINVYKPIAISILDSQVCAGGKAGRDACSGDSGGPLMVLKNSVWYAEGIVSFGKGCGEEGWPGIYTNVPYYFSWIKRVITQYLEGKLVEGGNSKKKMEDDYYAWSQ